MGLLTVRLATVAGNVEVIDEPIHTFGSADNVRSYVHEVSLCPSLRPCAVHGVLLDGEPLAVFGDYRATGVHAHSAVNVDDLVHLAIGGLVVCFRPQPFEVLWQLEVDDAACFGIHHAASHDALISHGELSIARYAKNGRLLWQIYGGDIFSEGFALEADHIEAVDFNGRRYRFSYDTGEPLPDMSQAS